MSAIAVVLGQNLESEQCPRYPTHNVKFIFGQTKKLPTK